MVLFNPLVRFDACLGVHHQWISHFQRRHSLRGRHASVFLSLQDKQAEVGGRKQSQDESCLQIYQHYKHILQERGNSLKKVSIGVFQLTQQQKSLIVMATSEMLFKLEMCGVVSGWQGFLIFQSFLTFLHSSLWCVVILQTTSDKEKFVDWLEVGPAKEKKGTEWIFQHKSMWNWLQLNTVCAVQQVLKVCLFGSWLSLNSSLVLTKRLVSKYLQLTARCNCFRAQNVV